MSRAVVDEAPFPLPGTPEALAAAEERFGPLFPQVYERELEHCAPAVAYEYARRECMAQPHERERRERQAREDEARRQRERERERKQWEAKLAEPEWAAAIA